MSDCLLFVFLFIGLSIFSNNFEIKPIKSKICEIHTFEKKFEMDSDLDQRLLMLSNINASMVKFYYLDKNYEVLIYDNYTHVRGYLCTEIDNIAMTSLNFNASNYPPF
jgi:hypothetical protein